MPLLAAADVTESAVDFLRAQGYEVREIERTWLGRVRIEATRDGYRREMILNPSTGEVLRDLVEPDIRRGEGGRDSFSPFGSAVEPPSADDRDDRDDRDDDRDDRDDRDDDRDDWGGDDDRDDDGPGGDGDSDADSDGDGDSDSDGGDD